MGRAGPGRAEFSADGDPAGGTGAIIFDLASMGTYATNRTGLVILKKMKDIVRGNCGWIRAALRFDFEADSAERSVAVLGGAGERRACQV